MKKILEISIVAVVLILVIQSCAVGPNYHQPETKNNTTFRYATESDSIINLRWWEVFNDPTLNTLIVTALRENKNLLIAASRVEQARANVSFTKADMGPKFGIQANAGSTNMPFNVPSNNTVNSFGASANVNWELDFWGKYRRGTEAAKADLLSSFYGKRALEIALISEVAINYFQLLDFKARLEIAENTLALRDSTLGIIQARFDEGYTHIIDVNQAQIQKAITQVSVPQFTRQIAFAEHNLSVLLGKAPDSIPVKKSLTDYSLPDSIPNGIPSEILQRRPDILQAAQIYRAQNAYVGVAQAMRFPSISLTGMLGLGSNDLSNLVSNGLGWSAGGSLTAPLFEWGKNKTRVEIEREKTKQALYSYEFTVLNALLEVDNSLIELSTLRDELIANENMLIAASNASNLSRQRYYQGVTSYLEVIENQSQEYDARLQYSYNYEQLLSSYISLYKSLGGGWISQDEIDLYAQQLADEQNVDVATINKDSLFYAGQIVDLVLTPEQEQDRKDAAKAQRKFEREQKKADRQNNN
ncbi:MAG: efflux transporter outer membrane subunit [Urechidicola sp.]|nr:efflux transporter outer membrane subunit [Urechidicola sp.]